MAGIVRAESCGRAELIAQVDSAYVFFALYPGIPSVFSAVDAY
jgi:hypothetical protein